VIEKTYGPVASTPETDLKAVVPVTGLKSEITYPYRVLVDGKDIKREYIGTVHGNKIRNIVPRYARITTTPKSDVPGKVRIIFGADQHVRGFENNALAVLMRSDYVSAGKNSWGTWDPQGREQIFRLIEKNRIPGVLLISGDRHGSRGYRIPRPSGYHFYEFEVGSLDGREGHQKMRDTKLFEFSETSAFGEFTIDATAPDPEVTFRLISDDGFIVHTSKLKRSQLTPRGN
jgi:phosphodiesterase/alkaline phosphatase D-like protein